MKMHNVHEALSVHDSEIIESRFSNAKLVKSSFDDVNLQGAAFTNVNLRDATFADVNLTNVSISDATLRGMTIDGVLVSDLFSAYRSRAHRAGAVLYAEDVARLQRFYQAVLGLEAEQTESDHVVLTSPEVQLVVLRRHESAGSAPREGTPRRRSETPIKLVFVVASIAAARVIAGEHGGELLPPEREWDFQGYRVRRY